MISFKELQQRKAAQAQTQASFAVDNLILDSEAKHIIDDYYNGVYATVDDAIKALDAFYGIERQTKQVKSK